MQFVLLLCVSLALAKISFAAQCSENPCQIGGEFVGPNYQCFQSTENPNNAICTCPDGQTQTNRPCRICETVYCGINSFCIERSFFEGFFYACACTNATGNYLNPGPCPDGFPLTTTPPLAGFCFNGGTFNPFTGTCVCLAGYTGNQCQTQLTQYTCLNVLCANGGVCNPNPIIQNGVEIQCTCLDGYSGANCELIGTLGGCTPGLCQNGGVCEQQVTSSGVYGFCRCPAGYTGRCCQSSYFSCPISGVFADPINCKYGRYFQCSGTTLITAYCPRGLRYNFMKMQCDSDVSCPP